MILAASIILSLTIVINFFCYCYSTWLVHKEAHSYYSSAVVVSDIHIIEMCRIFSIILYKEQKIKKSFAVVEFCCKGFLYCISWFNVLLSTALYLIIIIQYVFNVLNSFFVCMDTNLFPFQSQFCFSYVSYKRWWFHWKASFWDQRGICGWQWSVLWKDEKTQRDAPRAFSSMLLDGTECFYLSHHL